MIHFVAQITAAKSAVGRANPAARFCSWPERVPHAMNGSTRLLAIFADGVLRSLCRLRDSFQHAPLLLPVRAGFHNAWRPRCTACMRVHGASVGAARLCLHRNVSKRVTLVIRSQEIAFSVSTVPFARAEGASCRLAWLPHLVTPPSLGLLGCSHCGARGCHLLLRRVLELFLSFPLLL